MGFYMACVLNLRHSNGSKHAVFKKPCFSYDSLPDIKKNIYLKSFITDKEFKFIGTTGIINEST